MKKHLISTKKKMPKVNLDGNPGKSVLTDDKDKKKGDNSVEFKEKSDYYISLAEIIYRIKKHAHSDLRKPFTFSSELISSILFLTSFSFIYIHSAGIPISS